MEALSHYITEHSSFAPWVIFGSTILAGMNVPISIDALVIISAFLAAQTIPEYTLHLYLSILIGCALSAYISYWIGRLLGPKLCTIKPFSKMLSEERITKVRTFYDKYGFWTLVVGRFIPFGVRNGIFMSTGMSRTHFGKFALRDAVACTFWASATFFLFYKLGLNYETLFAYVKRFNILIFSAFSVTVIGLIWYKRKRKTQE